MLVRGANLQASMSQYLVDRILASGNIKVLTRTEVTSVGGDGHLERAVLRHVDTGLEQPLETSALFIFIGVAPRTEMVDGFACLDDKGFIVTGPDLRRANYSWPLDRDPYLFETTVPGVFAVGDVRAGASRRVAAAVGEGSAAMFSVHQYLQTV